jgi:2OG-Fe(II) oxygenase superfamily
VRSFTEQPAAFPPAYPRSLRKQIVASKYFTVHTLNRDFVNTRGFSVVFRRDAIDRVRREFPCFGPFLAAALRPDCNAFYLNPLHLVAGSRVDPHIDRSLRSYSVHIGTPVAVSVLYVEVPASMRGGELVLARGKKHLARIAPATNKLVTFDGDLTHSVARMEGEGERLSLVCEQYRLDAAELEPIPAYAIETRARYA